MILKIVQEVSDAEKRYNDIAEILRQPHVMDFLDLAASFRKACVLGYSTTVDQFLNHKYRIQTESGFREVPFGELFVRDPIAKENIIDSRTPNGSTSLILASQEGYSSIVRTLISNHASVNIQNNTLYTALMSASQWGHYKIVKLLLDANAFVDAKDDMNDTALLVATRNNRLKIVKLLLRECPELELGDIRVGNTALLECIRTKGNFKIVSLLIGAGASHYHHFIQNEAVMEYKKFMNAREMFLMDSFPPDIKPIVPTVSLDRRLRLI